MSAARRNERRPALARVLDGAERRRFGNASACARDAFDTRSAPGNRALFTRIFNVFNGLFRSLRENATAKPPSLARGAAGAGP
jgi:hypothetical protein